MNFTSWLRKSPLITAIYTANLLVSFHYFFVIYVNSSFISQYVSEQSVGLLYIVGSLLSVLLFVYFMDILRKFGNVKLIALLISLETIALGALAFMVSTKLLLFFFMLHLVVVQVIYLNLDIFLEKTIKYEGITGSARGLFLTMLNIAQVSSPIVVGLLLAQNEYWKAYVGSVIFLLIALLLVVTRLREFKDPKYTHYTLRQMKDRLLGSEVFYNVFVAQFLLRFFYAWMVIYTPLYLFKYIGFAWSEIGAIFTIMLVPFLILEFPLGRIADIYSGERKMLIAGFLVLGGTVALIPFLTEPTFVLWAILLFATRVGASMVEVGSESFFFKHVDGKHAKTISMFRATRPASYVVAATVASVTLVFVPLQWSFWVLALLMLAGVRYALKLKTG
jgi:MFS family permease